MGNLVMSIVSVNRDDGNIGEEIAPPSFEVSPHRCFGSMKFRVNLFMD